nr:MAG TPA: hypothetical protein [Caudoviricetes sp.]
MYKAKFWRNAFIPVVMYFCNKSRFAGVCKTGCCFCNLHQRYATVLHLRNTWNYA